MSIKNELKVGIIGLGYVGLPLARLMAQRYPTVGFDINPVRVEKLKGGTDWTGELTSEEMAALLQNPHFALSTDIEELSSCTVYIVAVPTPVDVDNRADLQPLRQASVLVGTVLKPGDLVIYESTVYPGVTEEECVPCLVRSSGLRYNTDFCVGYSPERVNPGDRLHTVETICKLTSGSTPEAARRVDELYRSVLKEGGTFPVSSIRVAEAAKIIENTQRDVNIAFMNELAKIFNAMGIDTREVIAAASTKWNFIPMQPGLVGGHCIGIDPYYLIQKAQVYGVMPRVISEARRLNDGMGEYVANQVVRLMNKRNIRVKGSRILILGFAFKENCPDTRNTKVADVYSNLKEFTSDITVYDPWVDAADVKTVYGITITQEVPAGPFDAIVLAVAHSVFSTLDYPALKGPKGVIYDVKGLLPRGQVDARL
ncbi:MAG: nucleotide sugar dehydrogenase [Bacteroidaceae bacterium]|jgi:UDP-N-acetyl-D-galactosamine dehydrogenase